MATWEKLRPRPGIVLGGYRLERKLDEGGNGEIWLASGLEGERVYKIVRAESIDSEKYKRFRREIETVQSLRGSGLALLPIFDSSLPTDLARELAWFSMPRAETVDRALAGAPLEGKVLAIRDIGTTLADLAAIHGIHHRDIKPANLYRHNDRYVVGDFGLVKRLEASDEALTHENRVPGPRNYLPPDAFLRPSEAQEGPIDVYCLAKTLWVIATEEEGPPGGPIRSDDRWSLSRMLTEEPRASELDGLIEQTTSNDPDERPEMREVVERLTRWLHRSPPNPQAPVSRPREGPGRLPDVVIGHPHGSLSTTPLTALAEGERPRLERLEPEYLIENKGESAIRDVRTGVRTHDGRMYEFAAYRAQLLAGGESSRVANVGSIPRELLEGIHPGSPFEALLYWVRFMDANGDRWEVVYDAGERQTQWLRIAEPQAEVAPRVLTSLDPRLLRGRIYPYMYAPCVQSSERALAVRCALAAQVPTDPEPALASVEQQAFEDAVANSTLETWLLDATSPLRRVSSEHFWDRIQPTRSDIVSLRRPSARMVVGGWTLEGRATLSLRPILSIDPPGWMLFNLDAVLRPESETETRPTPLSLEEFYELLYTLVSAAIDEIAPEVLPELTRSAAFQPVALGCVATVSALPFSAFVGLDGYGWRRAAGAYDPNGGEWYPHDYLEIEQLPQRAETVRGWIAKLLSDAGFSEHESFVARMQPPTLPKPPPT